FCPDHGFVWDGSHYTTIDVPNAVDTSIISINDRGVMTIIAPDQNGTYRSYLYDGTTFTELRVPGADDTFVRGINDHGDVSLSWDGGGPNRAAVLHAGTYYKFGYPHASTTYAGDLNDRSVMTGTYYAGATPHVYKMKF